MGIRILIGQLFLPRDQVDGGRCFRTLTKSTVWLRLQDFTRKSIGKPNMVWYYLLQNGLSIWVLEWFTQVRHQRGKHPYLSYRESLSNNVLCFALASGILQNLIDIYVTFLTIYRCLFETSVLCNISGLCKKLLDKRQ